MAKATQVLVLDDEPTVGERLKDYLQKQGMEVETFINSTEAIKRLAEKHFDVVATDLKMDGPNGIDVLVHVREQGMNARVIIMTAYATIEDAHGAQLAGVYAFVTKPFRMADMHDVIKKAARGERR